MYPSGSQRLRLICRSKFSLLWAFKGDDEDDECRTYQKHLKGLGEAANVGVKRSSFANLAMVSYEYHVACVSVESGAGRDGGNEKKLGRLAPGRRTAWREVSFTFLHAYPRQVPLALRPWARMGSDS